jgi:hypothetical protein
MLKEYKSSEFLQLPLTHQQYSKMEAASTAAAVPVWAHRLAIMLDQNQSCME